VLGIKVANRQGLRLRPVEPQAVAVESVEPAADSWSGARVAVRLVYDTRDQALPSGVRLVARRARRVLFEGEGFELPLQIGAGRGPGRVAVMGQVLADGAPVAAASVQVDGPERIDPARTDAEGSFRLSEIQVGVYRLEVAAAGRVLVTHPLELSGVGQA
jgi:carboxypeptidase family protein